MKQTMRKHTLIKTKLSKLATTISKLQQSRDNYKHSQNKPK